MKGVEVFKTCINLVMTVFLLFIVKETAYADWSIDIESGVAFSGYNDVRIPGNTGSDISLSEDLEARSVEFIRLRLGIRLSDRHQLYFLIAPLRFESSGTVDRDIDFNGVRFGADIPLTSLYRFDSYRVSYQYAWISKERIRFGIGFTGKVRDASISIDDGSLSSKKANTGFVPLINFALDWRFASKLGLIIEGDALAAPQGRAEDVLLGIYGNPSSQVRLRLGYRVLEGGADNDEVYTFALVHYFSAGLTWTF
jgi:hypothetical protein